MFDGFFLKTKGFLPKVYEILGSELALALGCSHLTRLLKAMLEKQWLELERRHTNTRQTHRPFRRQTKHCSWIWIQHSGFNRQCPESLWDKYHQRTQLSNHITRNCRDLQIPRNNLEYVKKGFHYSALKAWNEIPICIRELPTLSRFKVN